MDPYGELLSSLRTVPDFPKPGIHFKDITPLLGDAARLGEAAKALHAPWADAGITRVVAIEARGFILGAALACRLEAGFVPLRKKGKLPAQTISLTYDLEYGTDTIEMHADALAAEDRVLIHDDVLATGGTASASHDLVLRSGARVVGYSFLLEIGALNGRSRLPANVPVHCLLTA